MNKPLIIAITGGIGSGKSTLSSLIKKEGFQIYNTDEAGRRLQKEDLGVIKAIKKIFGEDIYTDGNLDRKKIAELVFTNKLLLKQLTDIIHPAIKKDFEKWVEVHNNETVLMMECAVLFEGGFEQLVDKIIVVNASEEIRIQRVRDRDGLHQNQIIQRMKNQLDINFLLGKADFVIQTDHGIDMNLVHNILNNLKQIASQTRNDACNKL